MRTLSVLAAFTAIAALSGAAAAQSAQDGGRMLIDPATGQARYVPPLLEPWQSKPVRLHPPHRHRAAQQDTTATASAPSQDNIATVSESAPQATPRPHKRKRVAETPTAQPAAPPSGVSDFTDLISPQQSAPASPPAKKKVAAVPPPKPVEKPPETPQPSQLPAEKPVQKANIEPAKPARTHVAAGTRKDSIPFAANATDPSTAAISTVRNLAGTLNSALSNSGARVQILAYAGMRGEKSSDTRRLSLKRALVVRQLLIDDGVPAERIDVFALGGVDDDGALDRVDVFVKG